MARSQSNDDFASYVGFHDVATMPFAASDFSADVLEGNLYSDGNGARIYLVGGCTGDQVCANYIQGGPNNGAVCACADITSGCRYFLPRIGEWRKCAAAPSKRYRHASAVIGQNLFVIGGRNLEGPYYDDMVTSIDVLNTVTDTWSSIDWPDASSDAVAFAYDKKLYIPGGYNANYSEFLSRLVIYDTTSSTWSRGSSMITARGDTQIVAVGNEFYVMGGWVNWCNASNVVEKYNPVSNTWSVVTHMIYGRGDLAAGVMGKSIFAIGGETKNINIDPSCTISYPVRDVTRYSNSLKQWIVETQIPADLFRFVGVSYNISTSPSSRAIYMFGGQGTFDESCKCYRVKDSTIKYIPASSVSQPQTPVDTPPLSPGGIAGVVIAVLVVAIAIVVALSIYCGYRSRGYIYQLGSNLLKPSSAVDFKEVAAGDEDRADYASHVNTEDKRGGKDHNRLGKEDMI